MLAKHWKALVEAIGLLAVVASLTFVGVQLRQDRVIARSELAAGTANYLATIDQIMADPDFASAYARMLKSPSELSIEEMLQVNSLLELASEAVRRECYLVLRGIFEECEGVGRRIIRRFFTNDYAQSWWRVSGVYSGAIPDWVNEEILEAAGEGGELEGLKLIQTGLSHPMEKN